MKYIIEKLFLLLNSIAYPLIKEFPFMAVFFVLIGYRTFPTLIVGLKSQPDMVMALKSVFVIFLLSYLVTCVVCVVSRMWVKWLFIILALCLFVVDIFLKIQFDMTMCPLVLSLIGETTGRESTEFFGEYVLSKTGCLTVLGSLLFVLFLYLGERIKNRRKQMIPSKYKIFIGLLVIIINLIGCYHIPKYFSFLALKDFEKLEMWELAVAHRYRLDTFTRLAFSVYTLKYAGIEVQNAVSTSWSAVKNDAYTEEDSIQVVLVIGESYNKYHSGLYGYYLETTPNLNREQENGNLFVFNDAISSWNMTSNTLKNLFCTNSVSDGEQWADGAFFPALFKKADFNVYSWDNQRSFSPNSMSTFSLESFLFNSDLSSISYTETNKKCFDYDDELVSDFASCQFDQNGNNLYIFHLMGQHIDVQERFPHSDSFMKFKADDIKRGESWMTLDKKNALAAYDNATLYNDYVIEHIIDLFRDNNAILLYLSDHGAELYDYRDVSGRTGGSSDMTNYLKYQYGIPFVIWCSNEYKKRHPNIVDDMQNAVGKRFMSDNLCQVLFHVAGLKSKYYISQRDILSKDYINRDRILGNRINYDSYMRRKSHQ